MNLPPMDSPGSRPTQPYDSAADEPIEKAYRHCPRCGATSESPGKIPFWCASCGMTLYLGPVAAVGGLVTNDEGELLLVRRAREPGKGCWGLPGGFVDRGETVEEALAREVSEETGLQLRSAELLMTHPNQYHYRGVIAPVIDLFYVCTAHDCQSLRLAPEEIDGHLWGIPGKQELDRMAFYSNRLAIERWLSLRE